MPIPIAVVLSVTVRVVSVVALNAVRPPHRIHSAAEERRRLRPRRHDVGLRVRHGTVVAQPPVIRAINEFKFQFDLHGDTSGG